MLVSFSSSDSTSESEEEAQNKQDIEVDNQKPPSNIIDVKVADQFTVKKSIKYTKYKLELQFNSHDSYFSSTINYKKLQIINHENQLGYFQDTSMRTAIFKYELERVDEKDDHVYSIIITHIWDISLYWKEQSNFLFKSLKYHPQISLMSELLIEYNKKFYFSNQDSIRKSKISSVQNYVKSCDFKILMISYQWLYIMDTKKINKKKKNRDKELNLEQKMELMFPRVKDESENEQEDSPFDRRRIFRVSFK